MKTVALSGAVAICSFLLVACGGDSDTPAPPPPPAPASTAEGLWVGTSNTGRTITGVVLDDGSFYILYSLTGNPTVIAGVVQGNGTSNNGSFSSTNARDFNLEGLGVLAATVSASYNSRQSLNGTVTYAAGATTFTSTFSTAYDATPSLAELAGTFDGQVALSRGLENASVTVSATGSMSGVGASGCAVTGSATPRARGNVFDVSLSFGSSPCLFANQTMTGIGYFDSAAKRLYAAAPNANRTDGVLFVGVKR